MEKQIQEIIRKVIDEKLILSHPNRLLKFSIIDVKGDILDCLSYDSIGMAEHPFYMAIADLAQCFVMSPLVSKEVADYLTSTNTEKYLRNL